MTDLLRNIPPGGREADRVAERAVLGAAIVDPDAMDELVGLVAPDAFYDHRHRAIWQAMTAMHRAGRPVDVALLHDELAGAGTLEVVGGAVMLAELSGVMATSANGPYYAGLVNRAADKRRLITAAMAAIRWAHEADPNVTVGEFGARVDELVRAAIPDRHGGGQHIGAFVADVVARAERGEKPVEFGTGFEDLDAMLGGGGIRPGKFVLLAARPSMGKTALLTRMMRHVAWPGVGVSIFSLEVGGHSVAANMLAAETRIPRACIEAWALAEPERQAVHAAADAFLRRPIRIHEGRRFKLGELLAAVRYDIRKHHSRVVAIDYVQLIDPDEAGRSRAEEVAEISRELKLLANDCGVCVVAAAQLSREVEKRREKWPLISDLKESGALEQDADVILLLHRPEYYAPEKDDVKGVAHVDVAKNRDGPTGVVDLRFAKDCVRFDPRLEHGTREEVPDWRAALERAKR